MIVIIVECAPVKLRGELSRWLIEPHAGVFVGKPSATVRDKLWNRIQDNIKNGAAILIHNANNEQGFTIKTFGNTDRITTDFDGIALITKIRK